MSLMVMPAARSAQKTPSPIKVISYNIRCGSMTDENDGTNSWKYRYPTSAMMIDDQKPDIFGLQEAKPDQMQYMKEYCLGYKSVGVGRDDGKKQGENMAIFYNKKTVSLLKWGTFWLSETPDVPSKGWDSACKRTATWAIMKHKASGKKFFYVNTHIDHRGVEGQRKGTELLAAKIKELNTEGYPVIVTGDFNMEPDNANIVAFGKEFYNARKMASKTDDSFTYHGWGRAAETIDYIWFKGFGSCTEYETITKPYGGRNFISDHYPVSAILFF